MSWRDDVISTLKANDIDLVAYLPDSVIGPLVEQVEDDDEIKSVLVSREEEAVALLGGAWLAGRRGALMCQTSGLANTFNALGSFIVPWGIPFVGLVTRRGTLGDHNKAQIPAGYNMPDLLDDVEVRNELVDDPDAIGTAVDMAAETAYSTETPYVLLLEPTVTGGKET